MARSKPGLAFSFEIEHCYAVGLVTHYAPRQGSLIWIARPTFASRPTLEEAKKITAWRWPVGFPVGAAINQKIIDVIGQIDVPTTMQTIPIMRGRHPLQPTWLSMEFVDLSKSRVLGETQDRSLPIRRLVNDTRLREMIESNYEPRNDW